MRRIVHLFIASLAFALVSGCASTGAQQAGQPSDSYLLAYEEGRYGEAASLAEIAYSRAEGADRERAALVAGLSAQALDRRNDAQRWLSPLLTSDDAEVAGRASAALGLIEQRRGNHERAVTLLRDASVKLRGDEAARASFYAGESYSALGRTRAARIEYSIAANTATSPELRDMIRSRSGEIGPSGGQVSSLASSASGRFTVQVGAYSTRQNALNAADQASARAARLGVGQTRITERTDLGSVLYVVQVGRFATHLAATEALRQMGGPGFVTTVDES